MQKFYSLMLLLSLALAACNVNMNTVEGNGIKSTRQLTFGSFKKLEVSGDFDVKLIPAAEHKVVVTADENVLPLIKIEEDGQTLRIRYKNNTSIRTTGDVKVVVYMETLKEIELAGSGKVVSAGRFMNDDRMDFTIAGSGNLNLDVQSPDVEVSIGGSGTAALTGKTRNLEVSIGGSGDYKGEQLMSENTTVSIGGSGTAKVHASIKLEANIAGSGDVYYSGNPKVEKAIAGSGRVEPLQ
ncbi:MAG: DUF2807 domain-containing protein [Chitinophagaceae bacterium]|nr:DUF2807 domain-containing protein [Chitinophagaceae bacterium]